MGDWLSGWGQGYTAVLVWVISALILLLAVLAIFRVIRGFGSGTYIAGGRNRTPRLAVVDATAVDNQRRLVLVRRDDVEHLILIGGTSDVVIEKDIRQAQGELETAPRRPRPEHSAPIPPPAPQPVPPRPRPVEVRPPSPPPAAPRGETAPRSIPERPPQPPAAGGAPASPYTPRPARTDPEPAVRREEPAGRAGPASPRPQPTREPPPPGPDEDEMPLLDDIDLTLDELRQPSQRNVSSGTTPSIEDEVSRLLGDLTEEKKR